MRNLVLGALCALMFLASGATAQIKGDAITYQCFEIPCRTHNGQIAFMRLKEDWLRISNNT